MKKAIRPALWGFLLLFLLFTPPLFGKGKQGTNALKTADRLIAEKRFSQALELLSAHVKANPGDFSAAQARIRKILGVKDAYNLLAAEFLDLMESNPDDQRVLEISQRLLALDPERGGETQALVSRIHEIALFRHNRLELEKILAEGSALIAGRRWIEAMRTYSGGFGLYREEFFAGDYDESLKNRVRLGIERINSGIPALAAILDPLQANIAALRNLQNQPVGRQDVLACETIYNRIAANLEQLGLLRSSYAENGAYFQEQLALIREANPGEGDRSFLVFAARLVEGRTRGEEDGMLGVFAGIWEAAAAQTLSLLDGKTLSAWNSAGEALSAQRYAALENQLGLFGSYAALSQNFLERWGRNTGAASRESLFDKWIPREKSADYVRNALAQASLVRYRTLASLGLEVSALRPVETVALWKNGAPAAALVSQEQAFTSEVRRIQNGILALDRALDEDRQNYASYALRFGENALLPFDQARAANEVLRLRVSREENASLNRQYAITGEEAAALLLRREAELGRNLELLHGSRRPSQVLSALTSLDVSLQNDLQNLNALVVRFGNEGDALGDGELSALYDGTLLTRTGFENLLQREQSAAAEARSAALQAQSHNQAGGALYAEARAAMGRGDFELARNRLLQAGEQYDASLDLEDSSQIRQTRDSVLPELDAEIARLENEAVIRDVNSLLAQTSTAFYQGDFDRAGNLLDRAQNRWRVTQTGENQEIINWRNFIDSALLSRSGRTIPFTAPLYAEMSQLLSEARKNYDDGLSYLGANRRNDGLVYFDSARDKIQKVRLLYPLNEDAGLLELRMDRELDPRVFNENFNARLQTARAGVLQQRSWQSFADLQNLFAINPNYPNRSAILYEAEIAMGIRRPPPDPQKIAASRSLAAEAQAIVSAAAGSEIQLRRALELCNQALANNPENAEAARLASRIYVLIGGAPAMFDRNTEQKFQRAGLLLRQNNALEAYSLVQEMVSDSRYRNNSRLLDLLQRIRANL